MLCTFYSTYLCSNKPARLYSLGYRRRLGRRRPWTCGVAQRRREPFRNALSRDGDERNCCSKRSNCIRVNVSTRIQETTTRKHLLLRQHHRQQQYAASKRQLIARLPEFLSAGQASCLPWCFFHYLDCFPDALGEHRFGHRLSRYTYSHIIIGLASERAHDTTKTTIAFTCALFSRLAGRSLVRQEIERSTATAVYLCTDWPRTSSSPAQEASANCVQELAPLPCAKESSCLGCCRTSKTEHNMLSWPATTTLAGRLTTLESRQHLFPSFSSPQLFLHAQVSLVDSI